MSLVIAAVVLSGIFYCVFIWISQVRRPSNVASAGVSPQRPAPTGPTEGEIFSDPILLADWVREHVLEGIPLSKDYDLLPNAENREGLEITAEQRDRCLCEYPLLRVAGTSLFVKRHYDDVFWMRYTDKITRNLVSHINPVQPMVGHAEIRAAVEEYVVAGDADDGPRVATLYMTRLYDDNPNYIRMKVSGIGRIGHDTLISHNDIMLDAFYQVKYGMSPDEIEALNSVDEKTVQVH